MTEFLLPIQDGPDPTYIHPDPKAKDKEFRELLLMFRVNILMAYDGLCEGVTTDKLLNLIWDFNEMGPAIEAYMTDRVERPIPNCPECGEPRNCDVRHICSVLSALVRCRNCMKRDTTNSNGLCDGCDDGIPF